VSDEVAEISSRASTQSEAVEELLEPGERTEGRIGVSVP
jgi:hypothetical protein